MRKRPERISAENAIDREPPDAGEKRQTCRKNVPEYSEREARLHHLRQSVARPERRKQRKNRVAEDVPGNDAADRSRQRRAVQCERENTYRPGRRLRVRSKPESEKIAGLAVPFFGSDRFDAERLDFNEPAAITAPDGYILMLSTSSTPAARSSSIAAASSEGLMLTAAIASVITNVSKPACFASIAVALTQ